MPTACLVPIAMDTTTFFRCLFSYLVLHCVHNLFFLFVTTDELEASIMYLLVHSSNLLLKMKTRQIMTPARLTIAKVFTEIRDKIAKAEGKNSQKQKTETMQKLIAATQRDEVKYLVRSFQAKLRVGINNATILVALAHAIVFADCCDSRVKGPEFGTDLELELSGQSSIWFFYSCFNLNVCCSKTNEKSLCCTPSHHLMVFSFF